MKIYIERTDRTPLLVDPNYFAEQSKAEEESGGADNDVALVRRVARAIHRTPQPSERLRLVETQAGTMLGIHMTAATLREANYCMGVYGDWAIMPFHDDENGFWVSELESGALVASNLRMIEGLRAVANVKLTDAGCFFDRLQALMAWQFAKPGTQIDVESFRPFGQKMLNLVETIRRQHNVLN